MASTTLGKGLGSLIPPKNIKQSLQEKEIVNSKEKVHNIEVEKIQPNPHQPRHFFIRAALEELMDSIKVHGIIQPLVVFESHDGYQLIAGERRLRAAKFIGLKKVPVIFRSVTEQEKLELALVENVQRQNLNPIERAYAYQRLADEFNLTQEEVAKKVGQSRVTISNTLRLLTLIPEIQKALQEEKITEGHAKVLLSVKTDEERNKLFKQMQTSNISVRTAERKARKVSVKKHTRVKHQDPNMTEKIDLLQESLGTKVNIIKKNGQGTINIHFYSAEELQEIIRKISN